MSKIRSTEFLSYVASFVTSHIWCFFFLQFLQFQLYKFYCKVFPLRSCNWNTFLAANVTCNRWAKWIHWPTCKQNHQQTLQNLGYMWQEYICIHNPMIWHFCHCWLDCFNTNRTGLKPDKQCSMNTNESTWTQHDSDTNTRTNSSEHIENKRVAWHASQ